MAEIELAPIDGKPLCVDYQLNREISQRSSRSTEVVVQPHQVTRDLQVPRDNDIEAGLQSATAIKAIQEMDYREYPPGQLKHRYGLEDLHLGRVEDLSLATGQPEPEPPGTALQPEEDEDHYPKGVKLAVVALALALALLLFGLVGPSV